MPPEFGADPAQAEQALQDWADGLRDKAQRFAEVRRQLDDTRITESGRSVTVTVDAQGVPTDVRFADSRAPGAELSAEFMAVLRRAQSRITERATEITGSVLGDDSAAANAVLEQFRRRFPGQQPPPAPELDDGDFSDETFLR
ncbi:YbaB/EbfC family nucleoid-associated protein [Saccharopolyspora rosea]|uniref:YbaB/EbfC family nucleoid-associated protein n=1 Tax=Saccharopolyspora rosea TaxID=524884 RepID=A0ABW3FTN5_9PSEU|nr:YbaB/EbfC family nucleoid-associated protein [Saccharopolyspora rosea]